MEWRQIGQRIDKVTDTSPSKSQSVAISYDGKRMAIGAACGYSCEPGPVKVKIYDLDGTKWVEAGSFCGRNEDEFGQSIVLSGDGKRLAIGVSESDENGRSSGHVETYEYKEGNWVAMGHNSLMGLESYGNYGSCVDLCADGSRMAVGIPQSSYKSGSVRVYEFERDTVKRMLQRMAGGSDWGSLVLEFVGGNHWKWRQIGHLNGKDGPDRFGSALSLSRNGDIVAVGAPDTGSKSGSVNVFKYSLERKSDQKLKKDQKPPYKRHWTQIGQTLAGNPYENFGWSLSLNAKGDIMAVGAPSSNINDGHVQIFQFQNNEWRSFGNTLIGEDQNSFGYSLCLAPNARRIAVCQYGCYGGWVKIFQYDGNDWVLIGNIIAPPSEHNYGASVSFSLYGDRLGVGTIHDSYMSVTEYCRVFGYS